MEAGAAATGWLRRGIFVVAREELTAPGSALHDLPPVFFAKGDRSLLSLTGSAVLNSRKSRRVTPEDSWIMVTKELVRSAMEAGGVIVSSYGNLSYSLVACLAEGFPLIVVCDNVLPFMDSRSGAAQFLSSYGDLFNAEPTLFISSFPPGPLPARANRLAERDNVVAALSSVLMVGEVRPRGNMSAILEIASRRKIKVIGAHPEEVCPRRANGAKRPVGNEVPRLSGFQQIGHGKPMSKGELWPDFREFSTKSSYLVHYTRSCPGPWPGQTMAQYCRSLIDRDEGSGHKAFDTLQRILEEKLIRASNRLTRGPRPVVSLTECLPGELSAIVRWRPGLIRWNFEPYGIGIRKDVLVGLGARPAIYGVEEALEKLPEDKKYLFQIRKSDGKEWTEEKEWRLPGDLLLASIRREDMVVFVLEPEEASVIENRFGYKVFSAGMGRCPCLPSPEIDDQHTFGVSGHRTTHGV